MSVLRIEKLIEFLKVHFESGIQMFDTPSIMPDFRMPIYDKDDILVLFAPEYEYIEIYGISDEEFERVMKEANGLYSESKVIGNIFDNPKLLESEE